MALTTHYHRSVTLKMLGIIKTLRHDYKPHQLRLFYNSIGVNAYVQVDCKNEIRRKSKYIAPPERMLVANLSNESGQIRFKDAKGQLVQQKELDAQENYIFEEFPSGIDVDFFTIIEWRQNGQCVEKYMAARNGYLIVE